MADPSKFVQITAVPRPPGGGGGDFTIFALDAQGLVWRLDPPNATWQLLASEGKRQDAPARAEKHTGG
jgi:hypothetical protein